MTNYLFPINENRVNKPCIFFGILVMFAALFIFIAAFLIPNYRQITTDPFLVMFSIGLVLFVIGLIPGMVHRKY